MKYIKSTADWNALIAAAGSKPIIVDFFAEWCGPCKMIAPLFESLAQQFGSAVEFVKVDVDEAQEVAGNICNVTAMPTFQVWKDGAQADALVGANPEKLKSLVAKYAA